MNIEDAQKSALKLKQMACAKLRGEAIHAQPR